MQNLLPLKVLHRKTLRLQLLQFYSCQIYIDSYNCEIYYYCFDDVRAVKNLLIEIKCFYILTPVRGHLMVPASKTVKKLPDR